MKFVVYVLPKKFIFFQTFTNNYKKKTFINCFYFNKNKLLTIFKKKPQNRVLETVYLNNFSLVDSIFIKKLNTFFLIFNRFFYVFMLLFYFVFFNKSKSFNNWYIGNLNLNTFFFLSSVFISFFNQGLSLFSKNLFLIVFSLKKKDSKVLFNSKSNYLYKPSLNLSLISHNKVKNSFFLFYLIFFKKLSKNLKLFKKNKKTLPLLKTFYLPLNSFDFSGIIDTRSQLPLYYNNKQTNYTICFLLNFLGYKKYKPTSTFIIKWSNRRRRFLWRFLFINYKLIIEPTRIQNLISKYNNIILKNFITLATKWSFFFFIFTKKKIFKVKKPLTNKTNFFVISNSKIFSRIFRKSRLKKSILNWRNNFFNKNATKDVLFLAKLLKTLIFAKTSLTLYFYLSLISYSFKWYLVLYNLKSNILNSISTQIIYNYSMISNNIPLLFLPKIVRFFLKKTKATRKREDFSMFFRQYLGHFFEKISHKKIFLKILPTIKPNKEVLNFIKFLVIKHRNHQQFLGRGFFLDEMLFIMWSAFFLKDINFLMTWITRTMHKIEFKKHKSFIRLLRFFMKRYNYFFFKYTGLKGLRFDIRGKLGVKGNAKKRHMNFSVNTNSFSKKKHRIEYKQGLVYTDTGVLGLTLVFVF